MAGILEKRLEEFVSVLGRRLSKKARAQARPLVPSRTLRRSMEIFQEGQTRFGVTIPYYWAIFVHDGRRAIRGKGLLVWFANPRDDPRTGGTKNYPLRSRDIRSMREFPAEWREGQRKNRERRKRGLPDYMIVRPVSGPVAPTEFFTRGLAGFDVVAAPIIKKAFDELLVKSLFSDVDAVTLKL